MYRLPGLIAAVLGVMMPLASLAAPAPASAGAPLRTTTVQKAQPGDTFTFSDVMVMVASDTSTKAVAKIKSSTKVQFAEVHLLKGYTAAADVFTPDEQQALVKLGAIIGRNTYLMNKLRHAGFLLSDVVAVTILDKEGSALTFINL